MDAAKNAVSSFIGRGGKQQTDVDEVVNPAVISETVKPHRHEETQEAIDKEIHQDHYHTTVQPIEHRERLPEQHTHQTAPQIEKQYVHGSVEEDKARVAADLGKFRDTSTVAPTTESRSTAAAALGEHHHHHVHEIVQPVIHKETYAPEVIHTTIPIHEKHIAPSEHHGISQLPTKSLSEFQSSGIPLTGTQSSREEYEGHPRPYNPEFQQVRNPVDVNPRAHDGMHDLSKTGHTGTYTTTDDSTTGTGLGSRDNTSSTSGYQDTSSGLTGSRTGTGISGIGSGASGLGSRDYTSNTSGVAGQGASAGSFAGQGSGYTQGHETTTTSGSTGVGGLTGSDHRHGQDDYTTSGSGIGGLGSGITGRDTISDAERYGSSREGGQEPSNLTGGSAVPRGTDELVQHASTQGQDPSLKIDDGARGGKLTGQGVPGSHSAVFGLTPDGKKYDDTESGQKHLSQRMPGIDKENERRDDSTTGSRGTGLGGVADQMNDPRVAQKGHGGQAEYSTDNAKPGAGSGLISSSTGQI